MELIRPFNKLNKGNADLAGGKGASLGEMTQAGIPVPPGFVVLSTAFERFLEETDLDVEVDAILGKVNHKEIHTVENASEEIKELILGAEMPKDIEKEIEREFKSLGATYVAVRSSATAEDGKEHAWAGQLDSFLNTTEKDLLDKVQHCWASLFTPRAIFYRFEKGLHTTKISVAVVVQKMVESEVSGIAFSVHPVTEDHNQLIIEAGFGLGEAIVSGQITPDSYVVEKNPRNILDINVSTQDRGLYKLESGGNEWQTIPEPKASSQVLTTDQILELSEIILGIEKHYGFPCDIEWAYENGNFYIVQSRPITTLKITAETVLKKTPAEIFIDQCGSDNIFSFEANFIPLFVMIDWLKYYDTERKLHGIYPWIGLKSGNRVKGYINDSKYSLAAKSGFVDFLVNESKWNERSREYERIKNEIDRLYEKVSVSGVGDPEELAKVSGNLLLELVFNSLHIERLDKKIAESVIAEQCLKVDLDKIWQISEIADFVSFEIQNKKELLSIVENNKPFEFARYIYTNYIHTPRVEELKESLEDVDVEQCAREITAAERFIEDNLKKKQKLLKECTKEERKVIEYFHWAMRLRDERKIQISKAHALMYRGAEKLLSSLKLDTSLAALVSYNDIKLGGDYILNNIKEIKERRDSFGVFYSEDMKIEFSDNIEGNIKTVDNCIDSRQEKFAGTLSGDIGSRGKYSGKVTIVLDPKNIKSFPSGAVLVAPMTRPEYVQLMKKAGAIITDEGGITCHAAIVSRELGIPCIIGTKNATKVLKDGDMVEVDADKGVVRIIK